MEYAPLWQKVLFAAVFASLAVWPLWLLGLSVGEFYGEMTGTWTDAHKLFAAWMRTYPIVPACSMVTSWWFQWRGHHTAAMVAMAPAILSALAMAVVSIGYVVSVVG